MCKKIFDKFYIDNPFKQPYSTYAKPMEQTEPKGDVFEVSRDLLNAKSVIDMHNKSVTVTIAQIAVSIALLTSSIALIVVTLIK